MDKSTNYITEEKRKELEKELNELKGPKRKEVLDSLTHAKSLGDLSENAEYHQAREDQGKLEGRIAQIESILSSSQVVKGGGGETIGIGSKISIIKNNEKEEKSFIIVGAEEADITLGKISNHSPLGSAFWGKRKGDIVKVNTPLGEVVYQILNVS